MTNNDAASPPWVKTVLPGSLCQTSQHLTDSPGLVASQSGEQRLGHDPLVVDPEPHEKTA